MVQHRAFRNAFPDDAASSTLAAYISGFSGASPALSVDRRALSPKALPPANHSVAASYDVAKPGNVLAALRIWEPLLRRPLRRLSLREFAQETGLVPAMTDDDPHPAGIAP